MRRLSFFVVSLSLLVSLSHASAQTCVVRGSEITGRATISPRGVRPFDVAVTGFEGEANLPAADGPLPVRFRAPLSFTAGLQSETAPLRLAGTPALAGGLLRVVEDNRFAVRGIRASGRDGIASLVQDGITIKDVVLPCDSLALSTLPVPPARPAQAVAPRRQVRDEHIELRADPESATGALMLDVDSSARFTIRILQERAGYARIDHMFSDGSVITGWVRRPSIVLAQAAVAAAPVAPAEQRVCEATGTPRAALLRRGAEIRSDRAGPVWTRATSDMPLSVEILRGGLIAALQTSDIQLGTTSSIRFLDCARHFFVPTSWLTLDVSDVRGLRLHRLTDRGRAVIRVESVAPNSVPAQLGLREGDSILSVRSHGESGNITAENALLPGLREVLGRGGYSLMIDRSGRPEVIEVPATCPPATEGSSTPCTPW